MIREEFNGVALSNAIKKLPNGSARMEGLLDAIRQADLANNPYWRLMFRYDYAGEVTFHDDPPKCIPISAEFSSIFQEYPDAIGESGAELYVMILQMAVDPMVYLPQIPISQWEKVMEEISSAVHRYQIGLRFWYSQAYRFYTYVDLKKAKEYYQLLCQTERDDLSDCEACERSLAVEFCLLCGDKEQADKLAAEIFNGRLTCGDVPQSTWLAYLEDSLDKGKIEDAIIQANALYQIGKRDKSDLSYLGAVLRCMAFSDWERGEDILQRFVGWTIGMWDKRKQYDFYKGAYVFCREMAKKESKKKWILPENFPAYQKEGIYETQKLADWFYREAKTIAELFDKRNGTKWYSENLKVAEEI